MAQYKCENCNALRDKPICPKCGADTHLIDVPEPSLEQLAEKVSRKAAVAETTTSAGPGPALRPTPAAAASAMASPDETLRETPVPARTPQPRPQIVPTPPPPAEPSAAQPAPVAPTTSIVGLDEFHAVLDQGSEAVVICGDAFSGKSEIAYGYIRANNIYHGRAQNLVLRATLRTDEVLGATNPKEVWFQPIDKKRVFLDPSGEFFRLLSPELRQKVGDITEEHFKFIQRAVSKLAGIVLVVDLTSAVDARQSAPWRRQETDLTFILSALRCLRWDKEARPQSISVSTNIAQRVSMFPRIDKRVLVLFSKADQLAKFTNQNPLDFARRRLPILHGALMTHARRFRYDFCNTMIKTDTGQDQAVDPCGVLLPMNWVLDDPFGWLPLQLPTSMIGGGK